MTGGKARPTLFAYDGLNVGLRTSDGRTFDVCSARHAGQPHGDPRDAQRCMVSAAHDVHDLADQAAREVLPVARPRRLECPVFVPRNVFGAPVNYVEHRGELGETRSPASGTVRDLGLFVKASGSVSGPADPIELPSIDGREFHYEGEVAIVIGSPAEDVSAEVALQHVAGFTGALDITLRLEADHREERSMRKSYKTFTPVGPALLPLLDDFDATELALTLTLNGEVRQSGSLRDLIMPVPELVALASSVVPLEAGDLILTGTPRGVGPLRPGDEVSLEITDLPPMELHVTQKPSALISSGHRS